MTIFTYLEWAIVLMLLGCALVALEVFVPSGGVLSFFAVIALVASIVMAFRRDLTTGLSFIAVGVFAVPSVVALAFKYWPSTPMGRAFLGELPTEEQTRPDDGRRALLGKPGVAQSKMLPSGAVLVEGQLVDAVSRGRAIDSGQAVVVVEVAANRVVVRAATHADAPTDGNLVSGNRAAEKHAADSQAAKAGAEESSPSRQHDATNQPWQDPLDGPLADFDLDGLDEPLS